MTLRDDDGGGMGRFERLMLIYNFVLDATNRNRRITLDDIKEHVASQFPHVERSRRTIQRDIKELQEYFLINIVKDRRNNTYKIEEEEPGVARLDALKGLMLMVSRFSKVQEIMSGYLQSTEGIAIEHENTLDRFLPLVIDCLKAIYNQQTLTIVHKRYNDSRPHEFVVAPRLVLERGNRWYLVAQRMDTLEWRTYGVDRILESRPNATPAPELTVKPKALFDNVLGVIGIGTEPERVVLKFTPNQAPYEKSYPWHPQFEVIEDSASGYVIAYSLVVNYELKAKIKSLGSCVEVLAPAALRQEIAHELAEAAGVYTPLHDGLKKLADPGLAQDGGSRP